VGRPANPAEKSNLPKCKTPKNSQRAFSDQPPDPEETNRFTPLLPAYGMAVIPMPEKIRPMLMELKKTRKDWIFDFPFQPSRRFQQFFKKIKLEHLVFHCTRVTFISRQNRAGVPREIVMRLVNHANELIHRIYQRENSHVIAGPAGHCFLTLAARRTFRVSGSL
jgi:hypothetical protein